MIFGSKKRKDEAAPTTAAPAPAQSAPAAKESPAPAAANATPTATPEEKRRRQALAHATAAAFGQIVSVILRSKTHRQLPIVWLEQIVAPAITTGQFFLAQVRGKENGVSMPVGVVLWASVSPEVDKRLSETADPFPRLAAADWKSGDIIWLMEAVGEARVMGAMVKRLQTTNWKDRKVKMRIKREDGKFEVKSLSAA